MRNLKKLLAVIVTVCMLATFAIPAFAEQSDADICAELGVVLGTGDGVTAEYLASQPDRLQGAIMFLRLKGLEDEAKAFVPTENFSDAEGLSETNKAILGFLKAHPEHGFVGIGNNMFAPTAKMTAKEYYKVLLVALGYEDGVDFTWATVFQFAASKGLIKLLDNTEFTVNDLCTATVEALKATVKSGSETLIANLVEEGVIASDKAVASGLYTAVPKAPVVLSATADNLKTAKIVFNTELDADTVSKTTISNSGIADVKLLNDKKTAVVIMTNTQAQSSSIDIVIDGVKSAQGVAIAKVTKTVTFNDTTFPVINGITVKNAKTLVVSASEPMNFDYPTPRMFDDIKIDGNKMTASTSVDFTNNTVTFYLTSLLSKGTHTVEIAKMSDYAGLVAVATSFNIDVPEDTTAPAIASAKMKNINEIEVTFDEDIATAGVFKIDGGSEVTGTQDPDNKAVFTIGGLNLGIGAIVEVKVEYKGQKDVVGNEVKEWKTFTFKVEDDTTLPTVTGKIDSGNKIVLTFSKTMLTSEGTVKVYKDDGTTLIDEISLAGHWKTDTNNTVAEIQASEVGNPDDLQYTDPKDIVVKITGAKDATVRKNALVDTTIKLKALDTKPPEVATKYKIVDAADPANDTITFYFTEAMDADTLKNLSNYIVTSGSGTVYVAGKPFSAIGDISLESIGSDNKSVTFKAKDIGTLIGAGLKFTVYALKDIAGNMMASTLVDSQASGNLSAVSAVAENTKKIVVTFGEKVSAFDPSVFVVRKGQLENSEWASFVVSYSIDGEEVTLNLSDAIRTDPNGNLWLVSQNESLAKNIYGLPMADATVAVAIGDKISPTASVEAGTATNTIVVKFSEAVDLTTNASAIPADIVVRKGTELVNNATISIDDATDTITIGNLTSGTAYKVSILGRGNIKDAYGNALAELIDAEATAK